METTGWQTTEELAKKLDQGNSTWLKMQNDGDKAVVVFLGEPFPREVCFLDGKYMPFDEALKAQGHKPSLRVAFNVAVYATKEVKVLEQGVLFFKDLIQVRQKYGLTGWAFELCRHGAAKDPKTHYSILPETQLTPAQQQEFQKLALHDLAALYDGSGNTTDAAFPLIDEKTVQSIIVVLKSLPKEAVDRFCKKVGVARIREITTVQLQLALDVLDALAIEFKPAAEVNPFD
ncbi:MAG: hypothetical protein HY901_34770 [Deltaproteobacteria bacterium]|nr:hypothetical protein [Deltaproteobacteria bacterium]